MTTWHLSLAANVAVSAFYLTIFGVIATALVRSGEVTRNPLGVATAMIFFSCGVGHAIHAEHLFAPTLGLGGIEARGAADWHMASWDAATALVGGLYLSLRRSYGVLLRGPEMSPDLDRADREGTLLAAEQLFRTSFEDAPIGMALVRLDGRFERVNQALADIVDVTPEELRAKTFQELTHPDDLDKDLELLDQLVAGDIRSYQIEKRYLRAGGEPVWILLSASLVREEDGRPQRAIVQVEDISVRKAEQVELERSRVEVSASRDALSAVLDAATETAIIACAPDGTITTFNSGAERMLGYAADEVVGEHTLQLFHDAGEVAERTLDGAEPGLEVVVGEARRGRAQEREWSYLRKDGARVPVSLMVTAQRGAAGEFKGFLGIARNLTDVKRAQEARQEAEHLFRTMFEQAPIGICLMGVADVYTGCILRTNEAMADLTGIPVADLLGTRVATLAHPEDQEATADALARLAAGASRVRLEQRFRHPDGHFVWALLTATTVPATDGRPLFAIAQVVDISERKQFEGQLRHLADHDPLTGLFNRRRFEEELERRIAEVGRYDRTAALLLVDLDGFKFVNDSLGHSAGDELITRIGGVFRASVRDSDIVARIGGDEFAVLLPETGEGDAVAVAQKLLAAVRENGTIAGPIRHASVTASIGIAMVEGDTAGIGPDDVVVEADIAMYDAKDAGRNTYSVFRTKDHRRERVHVRAAWLDRMRSGLDDDRFMLYAQPICAISSGAADWHELLLRYRDDTGDIISPGAFLYLAERFDVIKDIDRWVLRQAVRLLHRHHEAGNDIGFCVNISAKTLVDDALPSYLDRLLKKHRIRPGKLMIEVTETAAIVNVDRARSFAETLHAHGCLLALDDFGSGFASFYYLKHLAFDYLKIDGEFVQHLADNQTDQLVVRSVVDVARGLETKVIAEFVEGPETLALLDELGVDYAQGYHLGRPRPVDDLLPLPA